MNRIADELGIDPVRDPAQEREPDRRHVAERRRLHRPVDRPDDPRHGRRGRARALGRLPNDDARPARRRAAARASARRRSATRRPTDGQAQGTGYLLDRVPDGHEPERRPVAGVDQDQARRPRRRLLGNIRHRQRLEDDPEPDRRRGARRPVRVDHVRQLEHRLVAALHRHVRLPRDVRRRQRRRKAALAHARSCSRSPARSSRSTRPTSTSSTAR